MVKSFSLTLGFILIIQIGAFIIEKGKLYFAQELGYEERYARYLGRLTFTSPKMQDAFNSVKEQYVHNPENYQNTLAWQELVMKDREDHAKIELSGKLLTFLISAFGLVIFLFRRSKRIEISSIDWLAIFLGLFFMRDVLINSIDLIRGAILCDEAKLWHQLNLPLFKSTAIFTIFGSMLFFFIIYKIPNECRINFVASGLIGSLIGISIWLLFIGNLLL